MKKELVIEWKHMKRDVETPVEGTGMTLKAVLAEIGALLEMEGVTVRMVETVLSDTAGPEPESLLFNGVPIEDLLEGVEVTAISCSCDACDACEGGAECRAIRYNGEEYEAIPPDLIGRAALKALEME